MACPNSFVRIVDAIDLGKRHRIICARYWRSAEGERERNLPGGISGSRPVPQAMVKHRLALVSVVVDDYDRAIDFYTDVLGFRLVEDSAVLEQRKRWVVVAPPGGEGAGLLLAKASSDAQRARIGDQTGGRVFLFLYTSDFWHDYRRLRARGVSFVREPKEEPYGTVAVFKDLYGNLWDLLEPSDGHRSVCE